MFIVKIARYALLASVAAMATTSLSASAPVGRRTLSDPLSMIRRASPGTRTAGAIPNKVRPKKVVVRRAPVHYAKVAARRPKPVSAVLPTAVEAPMPIGARSVPLATAAPLPLAAPIAVASTSSSAAPFLILPAALSVLTIGGGGGTSITSAAPEPETWLMMILGFGFLGTTMRRRRRAERKALSTARG